MIKPTENELKEAFDRTRLRHLGYSLDQAMKTKALKICIERMAAIAIERRNPTLPLNFLEAK